MPPRYTGPEREKPMPGAGDASALAESAVVRRKTEEVRAIEDARLRQWAMELAVKACEGGPPAAIVTHGDGPALGMTTVEFASVRLAEEMYRFCTAPIRSLLIDD